MVPSALPHPDLRRLRTKLNDILGSISTFGPGLSRPPVIDASVEVSVEAADDITTHQEALPGLRALRDAIKRDLDVLEKVGLFDLYVYYISLLLTVSSFFFFQFFMQTLQYYRQPSETDFNFFLPYVGKFKMKILFQRKLLININY